MLPAFYWVTAVTVAVVAIWFIWGRKFATKPSEESVQNK